MSPRTPAIADPRAAPAATRIEPSRGDRPLGLAELWRYRGIAALLVRREMRIRYKQTVVGAAWAVLQPLAAMIVLTVVFGRLAGIESEGAPYPLFAYVALVPWTFVSNAIIQINTSIVDNRGLVTRVYFPRVIVPLATALANLIDLGIALLLLGGIMGFYGIAPPPLVALLPLVVLLALATALGLGVFLAAVNVRYRDVGRALPFAIQVWFFLTPIAYPLSLIPERWRALACLNPMTGVVEAFRGVLLGTTSITPAGMALSTTSAGLLLLLGYRYFRRRETEFADVV